MTETKMTPTEKQIAKLKEKTADLKVELRAARKEITEQQQHTKIMREQLDDVRATVRRLAPIQKEHGVAMKSVTRRLAVVERQAAKAEKAIAVQTRPVSSRAGAGALGGRRFPTPGATGA